MAQLNYLFLDCEWADVLASDLVSIALVSIDGRHEFYAESLVLPSDATPWVQSVVYPLLNRGDSAMDAQAMSKELCRFLSKFDHPCVYYDFPSDRTLCQRVIDGHPTPHGRPSGLIEPSWQLVTDAGPALERWWREHADVDSQRHHALHDARALRAAFLSLWGM
ncbi:hypothetical protein [Dyella sp. Tek66A03]|uniref:hypothetical protein n=1 Tax=Dyella sp. Tek66A03 TaxID=3458298 RepID=UPI00403E7226